MSDYFPGQPGDIWQVVRDTSQYYRAVPVSTPLSEHEESIKQGLSYRDACTLAGELYDIEQVMGS